MTLQEENQQQLQRMEEEGDTGGPQQSMETWTCRDGTPGLTNETLLRRFQMPRARCSCCESKGLNLLMRTGVFQVKMKMVETKIEMRLPSRHNSICVRFIQYSLTNLVGLMQSSTLIDPQAPDKIQSPNLISSGQPLGCGDH